VKAALRFAGRSLRRRLAFGIGIGMAVLWPPAALVSGVRLVGEVGRSRCTALQ